MKHYFLAFLCLVWYACGDGKSGQNTDGTDPLFKPTGIPAIDQVSAALSKEPNRADLYAARSEAHYNNELYAQAAADAERAIQLDSNNSGYYRLLANAYFDNNQSRPAIKTLEKAMVQFPDSTRFYLMAAEMQLIVTQYNDALIATDKLLKIQPYNAEGLFMKGQVLKYMGDTIQAMVYYQKAVEQDADHLNAYLQLSILAGDMGHALALQYLDNALRIDSTNITALMNKAWYYHSRKQYDQAMMWYEKTMIHHPQDPDAAYNTGLMLLEKGDENAKKNPAAAKESYTQARDYFDKSTKFEVTFGEAFYYRGVTAERLGDKAAALRDYDQAMVFEKLLQGVSPQTVQAAIERVKPTK